MAPKARICSTPSAEMIAYQEQIEVMTAGSSLVEVTHDVQHIVAQSRVTTGLCTVFIQHTSASLVIQENADPTVRRDLQTWISDLAPESRPWVHDAEGPDDMPAHAKSAITRSSETIPVGRGRLLLGTWQGLYVWEHRRRAHQRRLVVHVSGQG